MQKIQGKRHCLVGLKLAPFQVSTCHVSFQYTMKKWMMRVSVSYPKTNYEHMINYTKYQ